ncbi:hypothetical protein HBH56_106990 [Parastagonospora nodorum]|uniref:Protein kinase domain-containing protein n=2 Tax=Phaeosphaeria nodorum (strain SN15 / ATCC MYA-4574 / FGSC 10173) TaxID=321614 RepID=A0A7U2I7F7_PHANO|nr:hypothetical protein SNOG_10791 [Parastagonospora nodorum SN15]KAH3913733.1 hypothetical protein HBH56_106990 [Parastagonospora nodorum]EAT82185.1 hypothetical protein SNOG_10791 [Parastagonospora nodorum SN15]KAH3929282.1 hypothetical protein HBH54_123430 [Parastagonospora nodorum]KAH4137469.1 hypothetical protein HBH45_122420 [Parastagonospora nodorum]KAH4147039.1 hypothetical protein HBH44_233020 [Parastagonospora nodorum]
MSNFGFSAMPPGYTTLRPAGEGCSGRVVLALNDLVVHSARVQFQRGDEDGAIDAAVSRVVAVKISILVSHFADERGILESIRRQAHLHVGSNNIISLVESPPEPAPGWMVLSTLPFCCDLHSVANPNIEAPPLGLVWLVFQQTYHALDFLHNTCVPPISHGDLQSANILLGFRDPETETLPKVMLVDFGQGKDKRSEVGERDTSDLCHIVGELGTSCLDKCNGEGGTSYDAMRNFVSRWGDNEFVEPLLADIWNMFGKTVKQTIQSLTAAEEQEICDRVLDQIFEVAREGQGSGDIRQDVRRILE